MKGNRGLALYAAAAYLFLHLPLLVLTVFSFNASRFTRWEGFSFKWYAALAEDPRLAEATVNSLIIVVVATLLATCDVFLGPQAPFFDMEEKVKRLGTQPNPFIESQSFRDFIDSNEKNHQAQVQREKNEK